MKTIINNIMKVIIVITFVIVATLIINIMQKCTSNIINKDNTIYTHDTIFIIKTQIDSINVFKDTIKSKENTIIKIKIKYYEKIDSVKYNDRNVNIKLFEDLCRER